MPALTPLANKSEVPVSFDKRRLSQVRYPQEGTGDRLRFVQGICSRPRPSTAVADRQAVERVEAYLTACPDVSVTVRDLCPVAGMSERRLRDAFRRACGISPKRYMLAERLRAVRHILSNRSLTPITVTEAATSQGFYELGRFSVCYRLVYGEAPSDTLRASRR